MADQRQRPRLAAVVHEAADPPLPGVARAGLGRVPRCSSSRAPRCWPTCAPGTTARWSPLHNLVRRAAHRAAHAGGLRLLAPAGRPAAAGRARRSPTRARSRSRWRATATAGCGSSAQDSRRLVLSGRRGHKGPAGACRSREPSVRRSYRPGVRTAPPSSAGPARRPPRAHRLHVRVAARGARGAVAHLGRPGRRSRGNARPAAAAGRAGRAAGRREDAARRLRARLRRGRGLRLRPGLGRRRPQRLRPAQRRPAPRPHRGRGARRDPGLRRRSPACSTTPTPGRSCPFEKADAAQVPIDHVVPLAAAWVQGAAEWAPDQRAGLRQRPGQPHRDHAGGELRRRATRPPTSGCRRTPPTAARTRPWWSR